MRLAATILVATLAWGGACLASPVTLVTVESGGGSAAFVERATIQTDGNLRTAWFFNVVEPSRVTEDYDILKGQEVIDCVNNTMQLKYVIAYAPDDKVVWSGPMTEDPSPIRPGSMSWAKRDFVCDGKFDPKLNFEVDSADIRKTLSRLVVGK